MRTTYLLPSNGPASNASGIDCIRGSQQRANIKRTVIITRELLLLTLVERIRVVKNCDKMEHDSVTTEILDRVLNEDPCKFYS